MTKRELIKKQVDEMAGQRCVIDFEKKRQLIYEQVNFMSQQPQKVHTIRRGK